MHGSTRLYTSTPSGSLQLAEDADRRLAAGELTSPLAGVPIAIKDILCEEGFRRAVARECSKASHLPMRPRRSWRLLDAGMVPLGRTLWTSSPCGVKGLETSVYGLSRNPWDLEHFHQELERRGGGRAGSGIGTVVDRFGHGGRSGNRQRFVVSADSSPYGRISRYGLVFCQQTWIKLARWRARLKTSPPVCRCWLGTIRVIVLR
ncbi:MAG: amidase family protein [Pirellulaceae bacterium]